MNGAAVDYPALARAGLAAFREGRASEALNLLRQVTGAGRGDASVWVAQAYAAKALGDDVAALAAADEALRREPANARALIVKGDGFAQAGDRRSAVTFYAAALKAAPPGAAADLRAELDRVRGEIDGLAGGFEPYLAKALQAGGVSAPEPGSRFQQSLDLMAGRAQLYLQQPRFYYFPGLPQVQFASREATPWLAQVEASADAIRDELLAVMDDPALFAPYVEVRENRPNTRQAGMLSNADWSAFYLVKDGAPVEAMTARFPRTMSALAGLPLTDIPGRAPSVLFSRLEPGAHIPPHHGLVNTRLICHLPLITPEGCSFRVGSETRDWRYGQAWAFDDTIEHEAWNRSDQTRVILIFDVWKPEITEAERDQIRALFAAVDAYGGGPQTWGV